MKARSIFSFGTDFGQQGIILTFIAEGHSNKSVHQGILFIHRKEKMKKKTTDQLSKYIAYRPYQIHMIDDDAHNRTSNM